MQMYADRERRRGPGMKATLPPEHFNMQSDLCRKERLHSTGRWKVEENIQTVPSLGGC
jgi:hypothetical protein